MNKKTKLLSILGLVTAILFLFSSEVLAQSLSISGKVIDKNSQEPVIGASLTLVMLRKLFLLMGGLVSVLYWLKIPKRWMKLL